MGIGEFGFLERRVAYMLRTMEYRQALSSVYWAGSHDNKNIRCKVKGTKGCSAVLTSMDNDTLPATGNHPRSRRW